MKVLTISAIALLGGCASMHAGAHGMAMEEGSANHQTDGPWRVP
jgi:hypothetical protein